MVRVLVAAALVVAASVVPTEAQTVAPPGAASCSGCHARRGTSGVIVPLGGRSRDDILAYLWGFRSGDRQATVMDRIAKGFTEDEIRAIANFVSKQ
jgi:cytochrome c553